MGRPKTATHTILCKRPFCKKIREEKAEKPCSIIWPKYCDKHQDLRRAPDPSNLIFGRVSGARRASASKG